MWAFDRYVYNTRLQLGREEVIRPLAMGTNWQKIRIGVRLCISDAFRGTGLGTPFGFGLGLGVCQGSTTSFLADTVTDWIGGGALGQTAAPSGSLVFAASTPNTFALNGGRPNALWKVGSTYTFTAEDSAQQFFVGSGTGGAYAGQFMSQMYLDITKGSPNYTIQLWYNSTAGAAQTNITNTAFLTNMENQATPTGMQPAGAKSLAYIGAGLFDCLSIVNFKSWPNTEIDSLAVVRYL